MNKKYFRNFCYQQANVARSLDDELCHFYRSFIDSPGSLIWSKFLIHFNSDSMLNDWSETETSLIDALRQAPRRVSTTLSSRVALSFWLTWFAKNSLKSSSFAFFLHQSYANRCFNGTPKSLMIKRSVANKSEAVWSCSHLKALLSSAPARLLANLVSDKNLPNVKAFRQKVSPLSYVSTWFWFFAYPTQRDFEARINIDNKLVLYTSQVNWTCCHKRM